MGKRNLYWVNKDKYKKQKEKYDTYLNRDRNQRFYLSKQWQQLRLVQLGNEPLCQANYSGCTRYGIEIHHVIPLNINWSLRLSTDNLETRCKECHSVDTRREQADRFQADRQQKIEDNMNSLNDFT